MHVYRAASEAGQKAAGALYYTGYKGFETASAHMVGLPGGQVLEVLVLLGNPAV